MKPLRYTRSLVFTLKGPDSVETKSEQNDSKYKN